MRKSLLIIPAVILLLILFLGTSWLFVTRRTFPQTRGTIEVEGLSAPVEIYRDPDGVPHIYADTLEDLFFAQGFVHAQDRFWQMEFWRRIGSGRLAELFGKSLLGTDIYLRTVGFRRVAEREYTLYDDSIRRILDSYAAGVNTYILNRKPAQLGLEFTFLKLQGVEFEIEPWTPINTLTWLKIMAEDLGANMQKELYSIDLIRAVGVELIADYFPSYREGEMPFIVADREIKSLVGDKRKINGLASLSVEELSIILQLNTRLVGGFNPAQPLAFGKGGGIGSNSWVISGKLTATGYPLLANDPHLGIQMPSIWYEIGLHSKKGAGVDGKEPLDVRGFSFPGHPAVVVGHNDRIAWGVTNVGPDVQDLYIERINPKNPAQYEVNGEWVDMEILREEIIIQGEDKPYVLLVRNTRHGPVMTDHGGMTSRSSFDIIPEKDFPDNLELKALSLRWTALQPNRTTKAILLLNQARNFEDFREALRYFDIPAQNVVYADVEGNIGYQTPGLIPIRAKGEGLIPVPGWTDDYEWNGYIPYEELPSVYNPDKGYIVTANNPVVSSSYPYIIGVEFDHGYRARRIEDMIKKQGAGFSVEDMQTIHGDDLNLSALEILPYLAGISFDNPAVEAARNSLLEWDDRMEMESAAAALYSYFWVALVEEIFQDQIPEKLWNKDRVLDKASRSMSSVYHLLQAPSSLWWDDITTLDFIEKRDDILLRAFEKAYQRGTEELGQKLNKWRWGDIHTATFRNQTLGKSGITLVERIFNRGPVGASGGFQQVISAEYAIEDPFQVYHLSSMRQIIDLSNLSNSLMIHTTGQSGHPGHRCYDNFIEPWRHIRYHPTHWKRSEVEAVSKRKLVLKPYSL